MKEEVASGARPLQSGLECGSEGEAKADQAVRNSGERTDLDRLL